MDERVTTVVFDLDDTLIASERARYRAYRELAEFGFSPREAEMSNRRCFDAYYRGDCTMAQVRRNRWLDLGVPPSRVDEVDARYRAHHATIRPRHGAVRVLESLRRTDLKLVLLSNSGIDYMRERVRALGAEHLFDAVVDLAQAQWKPHPEAFRYALSQVTGRPRQAVMVGDGLVTDVAGALDAGFREVIWLTRRKSHPDPRVVLVPSLRGAERRLKLLVQETVR